MDSDMSLRLKVKAAKDGQDTSEKLSANLNQLTQGARDYLEQHKLLQYMQALLHAVIQAKPLDPFSFMISQISAARTRPRARPRRSSYASLYQS